MQEVSSVKSEMYSLNQWASVDDYTVSVPDLKDMVVFDDGLIVPEYTRSMRILVKYANHSSVPLRFALSQWMMFDSEGFAYDFERRNQFYFPLPTCSAPDKPND